MKARAGKRFFSTTRPNLQTKQVQLSDFSLLKDTKFNRIKTVRNTGFVVEDAVVTGPMIIFNSQILLWNVPQYGVGGPKGDVEPLEPNAWTDPSSPFFGWTEDMFSLFKYVDHKPELLLIGTGGKVCPLPTKITDFLNNLGIQTEISNSVSVDFM